MPGPTPTWNWPADLGTFLGGLLMLAIVGVLAFASIVWSWLAGRH
jgi:hypothetical protein